MSPPRIWTEDHLKLLKDCCDKGMSASQAAHRLGVTRNAAMGMATRRGWRFGGVPCARPNVVWTADMDEVVRIGARKGKTLAQVGAELNIAAGSVSSRAIYLGVSYAKGRPPKPVPLAAMSWGQKESLTPQPPRPVNDATKPGAIPLASLEKHQCRWPFGDPQHPGFGFCGKHREDDERPYCAAHNAKGRQAKAPARKSSIFHGNANDLARSLRRYA